VAFIFPRVVQNLQPGAAWDVFYNVGVPGYPRQVTDQMGNVIPAGSLVDLSDYANGVQPNDVMAFMNSNWLDITSIDIQNFLTILYRRAPVDCAAEFG